MGEKESLADMGLDRTTAERLDLWMATHNVSCREEAIHRLLNYALDSAGIERRPAAASGT